MGGDSLMTQADYSLLKDMSLLCTDESGISIRQSQYLMPHIMGLEYLFYEWGECNKERAMNNPQLSYTVQVVPNPGHQEITLWLGSPEDTQLWWISDMQGRLIRRGDNNTGQQVVPTLDWSNGLYLLSTQDTKSGKISTVKFVIQH
jgi:hypothetical protein